MQCGTANPCGSASKSAHATMQGLETVKESNPAARPGAQSAMRGLTRHFRAALRGNVPSGRCEKIGSAAGRVARNGKSWWRRFGGSPRCNAGTDETFSRRICAEMFRLSPYCPRIAPKDQSGRPRSVATTVDFQEFGPTRSPFRYFHVFLTRYFRAAVARKYSVCPRIARKPQSGRPRSVATIMDC